MAAATNKQKGDRMRNQLIRIAALALLVFAVPALAPAQVRSDLPAPPKRFEYVDFGSFSIALPKGEWKLAPRRGIDSYVGAFVIGKGKKKLELEFDLGYYSAKPDTGQGYAVIRESIHGNDAIIAFPQNGAPGYTAVWVDFGRSPANGGWVSLAMHGKNLNSRQQELALAIFRSIYVTYNRPR